jgi:hypothetical protein
VICTQFGANTISESSYVSGMRNTLLVFVVTGCTFTPEVPRYTAHPTPAGVRVVMLEGTNLAVTLPGENKRSAEPCSFKGEHPDCWDVGVARSDGSVLIREARIVLNPKLESAAEVAADERNRCLRFERLDHSDSEITYSCLRQDLSAVFAYVRFATIGGRRVECWHNGNGLTDAKDGKQICMSLEAADAAEVAQTAAR